MLIKSGCDLQGLGFKKYFKFTLKLPPVVSARPATGVDIPEPGQIFEKNAEHAFRVQSTGGSHAETRRRIHASRASGPYIKFAKLSPELPKK